MTWNLGFHACKTRLNGAINVEGQSDMVVTPENTNQRRLTHDDIAKENAQVQIVREDADLGNLAYIPLDRHAFRLRFKLSRKFAIPRRGSTPFHPDCKKWNLVTVGGSLWQSEMSCDINALGGECVCTMIVTLRRRINVKIAILAIPFLLGTIGALAFLLPPGNLESRLGTAGTPLFPNLLHVFGVIQAWDSSNWFHYHSGSSIILNIVCVIGVFAVENHGNRRRAGETKATLSEAFLVCTMGFQHIQFLPMGQRPYVFPLENAWVLKHNLLYFARKIFRKTGKP